MATVRDVTFVTSTLEGGGGARAMCNLANHMAGGGRRVALVTLTHSRTDFYELHPAIERIGLDLAAASRNPLEAVASNIRRILAVRRVLRATSSRVVVAFMDRANVLAIVSSTGLGVPVVVCEQIDPRQYPVGRIWGLLRRVTYSLAEAIVVLSPLQVPWAARRWGRDRIHVIPNPAPSGALPPRGIRGDGADERREIGAYAIGGGEADADTRKTLLAIGRLDRQKGFDLLLDAFARLASRHRDWDLVILGEGPERVGLERLRAELNLVSRVVLPGLVADVGAWLKRADLFVLSSRFEGFPNVLLEAMAAGLAVVSFDCPTGPSEIIRHGVDGILVSAEDVDSLAHALSDLMGDEAKRRDLGAKAAEGIERFSLQRIVGRWDALFDSLFS